MIRVTGMKNVKMWMKFARSDSISVFMEVVNKKKKNSKLDKTMNEIAGNEKLDVLKKRDL